VVAVVIYVDILIVLNLVINFFLLKAVFLFARENAKSKRVIISAVIGAVYSLIILVPNLNGLLSAFFKILVSGVMIFIAFGRMKLKSFIKRCAYFYIVSSIFAGLMFALYYFLTPIGMFFSGGIVYFQISAPVLLISSGIIYLLLSLIFKIFVNAPEGNALIRVVIKRTGKTANLYGMVDTGNHLNDSLTGRPVVVCSFNSVKSLLSEGEEEFFKGKVEKIGENMRIVPCRTASGDGILPAFSPDEIEIFSENGEKVKRKALVAVSRFLPMEYDCLLSTKLYEGE
jgi:stage II sporulation protein GA (sporulation sigma-E factor processing peptidase)